MYRSVDVFVRIPDILLWRSIVLIVPIFNSFTHVYYFYTCICISNSWCDVLYLFTSCLCHHCRCCTSYYVCSLFVSLARLSILEFFRDWNLLAIERLLSTLRYILWLLSEINDTILALLLFRWFCWKSCVRALCFREHAGCLSFYPAMVAAAVLSCGLPSSCLCMFLPLISSVRSSFVALHRLTITMSYHQIIIQLPSLPCCVVVIFILLF